MQQYCWMSFPYLSNTHSHTLLLVVCFSDGGLFKLLSRCMGTRSHTGCPQLAESRIPEGEGMARLVRSKSVLTSHTLHGTKNSDPFGRILVLFQGFHKRKIFPYTNKKQRKRRVLCKTLYLRPNNEDDTVKHIFHHGWRYATTSL